MGAQAIAQQQNTTGSTELESSGFNFEREDEVNALEKGVFDVNSGAFPGFNLKHDFGQIPVFSGFGVLNQSFNKRQTSDQQVPGATAESHFLFPASRENESLPNAIDRERSSKATIPPAENTTSTFENSEPSAITARANPDSSLPTEPVGMTTDLFRPVTKSSPEQAQTESQEDADSPEEQEMPQLIVEDKAVDLKPGQMEKSQFLADVRAAVLSEVKEMVAATGKTTVGCPYLGMVFNLFNRNGTREINPMLRQFVTADCPYLELIFRFFNRSSTKVINETLRQFVTDTSALSDAQDYIPIITERVRKSAKIWTQTGKISGLPQGVPMDLLTAARSLRRSEKESAPLSQVQFKEKAGGAKLDDEPQAIQEKLGNGRPLDGGVRSRMEPAFGMSFSHVRVHNDITGARLSNRFNARAFTIGQHVAFGTGEYQPGTPIGDALIAHELAHVVQQRHASSEVALLEEGHTRYDALERDADISARNVLVSLWDGVHGATTEIVRNALPRLRSGLQLQRCPSKQTQRVSQAQAPAPTPTQPQAPTSTPSPSPSTSSPGMSIDVLIPPRTNGDCGGVLSQVRWRVPSGSPDGTIIQHLHAKYDKLEKCNGTKINPIFHPNNPLEFYEAWEVKGGKIHVGWANPGASEHRSDTFSGNIDYGADSRGKGKATGKVAFLRGYNQATETGWGPHRFAGSLPTRSTPPQGWNAVTKLDHWLSTEWECCPPGDRSKWTKTKVDGAPK